MKEKQYRLRNEEGKVVGYAREVSENRFMYSPDGFWWTGKSIEYNEKDAYTGIKDKNRKNIFVHDVVQWSQAGDEPPKKAVVIWGEGNCCTLKDLKSEELFPLFFPEQEVVFMNELTVIGYVRNWVNDSSFE